MAPPMKVYSTLLPLPALQRLDRCLHALSSNNIGQWVEVVAGVSSLPALHHLQLVNV